MENLISETYNILQSLRKLQNDVGHESDVDLHNIRKSYHFLEVFYQEVIQAAFEQKVASEERERKEIIASLDSKKKKKKAKEDVEEYTRAALDLLHGSENP